MGEEKFGRSAHPIRTMAVKGILHMHGIGISELSVILIVALIRFGIPIAFAIWVIVAIKRVSSRLDVVERILMDKKA